MPGTGGPLLLGPGGSRSRSLIAGQSGDHHDRPSGRHFSPHDRAIQPGIQVSPYRHHLSSNTGGAFGPELKFAGYDGIIIKGAATELTYLKIMDD